MAVVAGNGGEYWGYDGQVDPGRAARSDFRAGERRFLAYELEDDFGNVERGAPNAYRCDFHGATATGHLRFNEIAAKHGYDSVSKARLFALRFNEAMAWQIHSETDSWCESVDLD